MTSESEQFLQLKEEVEQMRRHIQQQQQQQQMMMNGGTGGGAGFGWGNNNNPAMMTPQQFWFQQQQQQQFQPFTGVPSPSTPTDAQPSAPYGYNAGFHGSGSSTAATTAPTTRSQRPAAVTSSSVPLPAAAASNPQDSVIADLRSQNAELQRKLRQKEEEVRNCVQAMEGIKTQCESKVEQLRQAVTRLREGKADLIPVTNEKAKIQSDVPAQHQPPKPTKSRQQGTAAAAATSNVSQTSGGRKRPRDGVSGEAVPHVQPLSTSASIGSGLTPRQKQQQQQTALDAHEADAGPAQRRPPRAEAFRVEQSTEGRSFSKDLAASNQKPANNGGPKYLAFPPGRPPPASRRQGNDNNNTTTLAATVGLPPRAPTASDNTATKKALVDAAVRAGDGVSRRVHSQSPNPTSEAAQRSLPQNHDRSASQSRHHQQGAPSPLATSSAVGPLGGGDPAAAVNQHHSSLQGQSFESARGAVVQNSKPPSQHRSGFTTRSPSPMNPNKGPDVDRVFVISGFGDSDRRDNVAKMILSLGQRASIVEAIGDEPPPLHVTHVVVPDKPRNLKAICALVSGRWVVTEDYVIASVKLGYWLKETIAETAIRCQPSPFEGTQVLLQVAREDIRDRLELIIRFGGGSIISNKGRTSTAPINGSILITSAEDVLTRCQEYFA